MDIDLEKFRAFFAADRWAAVAGVVIDSVAEDLVECSMEITGIHRNAGGAVQGGAIFTLADLAFAVHSNLDMVCGANLGSVNSGGAGPGLTVGQSCSISYLKSSRGKRLIARSACLSKGRSMSVYRISVSDDLGVPIAEMIGNGFTTAKKPSP
jgi:acyl-CoA thioesterase